MTFQTNDDAIIETADGPQGAGGRRRQGSSFAGNAGVIWLIGLLLAAVAGTLLFIAGFLFGAGGRPAAGVAGCTAPSEAFAAFCEAYERVQAEYVDPLDEEKLADGALRGLFEYGIADPYSAYMPPEVYNQARQDLSGRFEGIGAEMEVRNLDDPETACTELSETCALTVVAPIADSPAEAAGLQAGDIVRSVDGEDVAGSTMQEQVNRVRGPAGTDVTLGIERDEEMLELTITRAEIVLREVQTRVLEGNIGYISLSGFSDKSGDEFRAGLEELLSQGVERIVFDLRNNPGGYIDAAQDVTSQFVDSGVIFTQESHGEEVREWHAEPGGVATDPDIEIAVLTNEGSASASEIVAVALQERDRATIIGQPSFGKDTVQVWAPLENEGGVRITISRWFGPNHVSVAPRGPENSIKGVQPDIVVEIPEDAPPDVDLILERAVSFLETQSASGESSYVDAAPGAAAAGGALDRLAAYSPEALSRLAA